MRFAAAYAIGYVRERWYPLSKVITQLRDRRPPVPFGEAQQEELLQLLAYFVRLRSWT
jgi:hypothetical protein